MLCRGYLARKEATWNPPSLKRLNYIISSLQPQNAECTTTDRCCHEGSPNEIGRQTFRLKHLSEIARKKLSC
jgi:hypothetical protein